MMAEWIPAEGISLIPPDGGPPIVLAPGDSLTLTPGEPPGRRHMDWGFESATLDRCYKMLRLAGIPCQWLLQDTYIGTTSGYRHARTITKPGMPPWRIKEGCPIMLPMGFLTAAVGGPDLIRCEWLGQIEVHPRTPSFQPGTHQLRFFWREFALDDWDRPELAVALARTGLCVEQVPESLLPWTLRQMRCPSDGLKSWMETLEGRAV